MHAQEKQCGSPRLPARLESEILARPATLPRARVAETGRKAILFHFHLFNLSVGVGTARLSLPDLVGWFPQPDKKERDLFLNNFFRNHREEPVRQAAWQTARLYESTVQVAHVLDGNTWLLGAERHD